MTLEELIAGGYVVAIPRRHTVNNHPGAEGLTAYVACEPLRLGASDGSTRGVNAGDLLSADEVEHAGTGLHRLLHAKKIVALPADRGLVALARVLLDRVDRAEGLLADLYRAHEEKP